MNKINLSNFTLDLKFQKNIFNLFSKLGVIVKNLVTVRLKNTHRSDLINIDY